MNAKKNCKDIFDFFQKVLPVSQTQSNRKKIIVFIFPNFKTTKNKTWKDIAAQLGIGASSSGAYTLKKHYGKNLLPFECHFDRGGMDPGPILAQVEAQTKKKAKAASASHPPPVPSPGSQDSRDSYSNSSDPYSAYPMGGSGPPPPSSHNSYPPSRSATTTPPSNSGASSDRPPSHPGRKPNLN